MGRYMTRRLQEDKQHGQYGLTKGKWKAKPYDLSRSLRVRAYVPENERAHILRGC